MKPRKHTTKKRKDPLILTLVVTAALVAVGYVSLLVALWNDLAVQASTL